MFKENRKGVHTNRKKGGETVRDRWKTDIASNQQLSKIKKFGGKGKKVYDRSEKKINGFVGKFQKGERDKSLQ